MTGYSGTPLAAKLGIKPAMRLALLGAPSNYESLLQPLPPDVSVARRATAQTDIVQLFVIERYELKSLLAELGAKLKPDAALWVSWPKKASKVPTDITEDTIRELALPLGWVDVKVCAVDGTWSGLKLVVRKELR
jgi:hypothetical protein